MTFLQTMLALITIILLFSRVLARDPDRFISFLLNSLSSIYSTAVEVNRSLRESYLDSASRVSAFLVILAESFWWNRRFIWFIYLPSYIFLGDLYLEYAFMVFVWLVFISGCLALEYYNGTADNERLISFLFDRSLEHIVWLSIFLFFSEVAAYVEICYVTPLLDYLWP